MCRSANYEPHSQGHEDAADPLTITGFYARLCASSSEYKDVESASRASPIPDSLTLLLHPPLSKRNDNNNNIRKIPPFSPATLALRRIRIPDTAATDGDVIVFGNKHVVRAATKVLNFQLYVGEAKLLRGAIRKLEGNHGNCWKMELCKCELIHKTFSISEVELWVNLDGHVAVSDKVSMKKPMPTTSFGVDEYKTMKNKKHRTNKSKLEDIPEEPEFRVNADINVDFGADADPEIDEAALHLEMDLEVLRKAFDMGIWVLCLGFGFVISKSSITTNFRPPPTFF